MSARLRRLAGLALLLLGLALAPAAAPAAAPQPRTTLPAMEQQVMCVVCRTPLAVANGPQAEAERQQIRELIAQGKSERQIKDALVAQYGQRVLALPRWRRRARARAAQPALAVPAPSAEELRRLDDDLARHD